MIIERGASVGKSFVLTEDTVFNGGNHRVPKIMTMGLKLTINHPIPGATIDGEKDPSLWPSNVIVNAVIPVWSKDYKFQEEEQYDLADDLNSKLEKKGGKEAQDAFNIGMVDWIHANPLGTYQAWEAYYIAEAQARGWFANVSQIRDYCQTFFGVSSWSSFVAIILEYSPDVWRGDLMVTGEVA